jgi:hypothetical protein
MNALKKELELSLKCYEEYRAELKDMVTQYDAQNILLEANANLIAELKKGRASLKILWKRTKHIAINGVHIWRPSIVGL